MSGVEAIAEERGEQLTKHGFTIEGDVKNCPEGSLIMAAQFCLSRNNSDYPATFHPLWGERILEKPLKERLAIAGALLAAEIDRLNAIGQ